MTNHRDIIAARGGIRPLARSLDHRNHTTVQGWWERSAIPDQHMDDVLAIPEVASQRGSAAA